MNAELIRTELKRFMRQTPLQRFQITFVGGEIGIIGQPDFSWMAT